MPFFQLNVINKKFEVEAEPDMPLLWVLRDLPDLTGTKYGCGLNTFGACTVPINNRALRSCQIQVQSCTGLNITTIEGLSDDGSHLVQKARSQMEGALAFGLGQALKNEITVKNSRVVQDGIISYQLLRHDEMPPVEAYIVPSTVEAGAVSKVAVPNVAPALCNALGAAGYRPRNLPI